MLILLFNPLTIALVVCVLYNPISGVANDSVPKKQETEVEVLHVPPEFEVNK